jgi:hypothetical protein
VIPHAGDEINDRIPVESDSIKPLENRMGHIKFIIK